MLIRTTLFLLVLLTAGSAYAHNTYFLPGDSFFFTRLSPTDIKRLKKVKDPIWTYANPSDASAGCGYIGYQRLQASKLNKETRLRFEDLFELLKDELETNFEGEPLLNVLIYSKGYDWQKFGLALQYNENWCEDTVRFGISRESARLESFPKNSRICFSQLEGFKTCFAIRREMHETPGKPQSWITLRDASRAELNQM